MSRAGANNFVRGLPLARCFLEPGILQVWLSHLLNGFSPLIPPRSVLSTRSAIALPCLVSLRHDWRLWTFDGGLKMQNPPIELSDACCKPEFTSGPAQGDKLNSWER